MGGKEADDVVAKLKEFSFVIRKVLSKKIVMKFLPKLHFVKDDSFDYAEKIVKVPTHKKSIDTFDWVDQFYGYSIRVSHHSI